MLPSADKLYGDADFIFQQDLAPAHTAKCYQKLVQEAGIKKLVSYVLRGCGYTYTKHFTVLDRLANSPDLNPVENLWGIVKRKMRDTRPNNADDLKAAFKVTWASITPEQCHRLIISMPGPTKY